MHQPARLPRGLIAFALAAMLGGLILVISLSSPSRAEPDISRESVALTPPENYDPAQDEDKTYPKPKWKDERLDWCFVWGKDCGQSAADHFCRRRRFTGAKDFRAEPNVGAHEPTRVAGTDQVCNQPWCTGFEYITCFGPLPPDQVFGNPTLDNRDGKTYRLDWCLNWQNDCGKPAADAFCRANGFPESIYYQADPGVGTQPTMLIGTRQICNASFCTAFQIITCKPKPKPLGKYPPPPTPTPGGIKRIETPVKKKGPFE